MTCEALKAGVDRIFVPRNVLSGASVYGDAGEVAISSEANISFWDDNPTRQSKMIGAQDQLIF
jgi:hypothetical protein